MVAPLPSPPLSMPFATQASQLPSVRPIPLHFFDFSRPILFNISLTLSTATPLQPHTTLLPASSFTLAQTLKPAAFCRTITT